MSMENAGLALIAAFQGTSLNALPTNYEGTDFAPPPDAQWIDLINLPADLVAGTLGANGDDVYTGVFQIDFTAPKNSGAGVFADAMQTLRDAYRIGNRLTYSGQTVRIIKAVPSPLRAAPNGGNVQSMSIYWDARIPRAS